MKKVFFTISGLGIIIFVLLAIAFFNQQRKNNVNDLYEEYRYPNEAYYGKDLYSEINYECSEYESEIGKMIVDKAIEVAKYKGTKQDSENEMGYVGALSKYFYFDTESAVTQEAAFQFITCKITGNEGHVWVETTIMRFDEKGDNAGGGGKGMLSLWYIECQEGEWNVVKILNTP